MPSPLHHLLRLGLGGDSAPNDRLWPQLLRRENAGVFGWIFASHQFGAAIAAAGAGRIRDAQGNYDLAFYLAAGLCAVAAVMCVTVRNAQVKAD